MSPSAHKDRGFTVHALGEIAIRCADKSAMERFYSDVIGLEKLADRGGRITFFRIAPGHAGHTAVLALFDAAVDGSAPPVPPSSLHHFALTVDWDEQDAAIAWYESLGQPYRVENFDWIGWRGVFTDDPEGNTVELVAARPGGGS